MNNPEHSFEAQMLAHMRRVKDLLPCCPNCEHFNFVVEMTKDRLPDGTLPTRDEGCNLDPTRARPPARVIAFGCPAFEPTIPF